jgi:hypothetical protein
MKRDHFRISFLSDDREPRLSRSHSAEGEDEVTETEGIDVDDAEGGDVDEEEDAEEEDIGEFWGGMEDPGSVARVGREEAAEDCEMWADLDSVRNSEVEAVPIIRDSEPSINDSVSPVVSFISGDILTMFDRTTNRVKVAVEMKAA